MWIIAATTLLFSTTTVFAGCSTYALQADIAYDRIDGEWDQVYFSPDSIYSEVSCSESKIYGLNEEAQEFSMRTIVNQIIGPKRKPIKHVVYSTACYGPSQIPGATSVKDHLATDYENYLIMYQCNAGKNIVSVELRKGKSSLPLKKIREVATILENVGVDFFSMAERHELGCTGK